MAIGKSELQILINAKDNASGALGKTRKALNMVGVAAIAVAGASVKMAADFDKGMREVATLTPQVADNLDEMKTSVLNLSKSLGIDAVEATGALYEAISAGVPTDNAISFLEIASKAAIGGVTDTKTAVDGLTTVMNAFSSQGISAQEAADVLFGTIKAGKTNFAELSASMFQVAPLANAAGVSFEEVAAAMATITAQGTPTRVATTQLRAAIQGLTKPSDEMTQIFQAAGFASGELAVQQLGLAGAAKIVTDATGGSISGMTTLLGSIEGVQAILGITGDNAEAFAKNVDNMGDSAGAATAAFDEMEKSTSRQFEKAKNQMKVLAIEIGTKLLPVINDLLTALTEMDPVLQDNLIKLAGIAAAVGVLSLAIGPITALVGALTGAFAAAKIVIPLLIFAVKLLVVALVAILGPIGAVIAGVVALGIGILAVGAHFGWWSGKLITWNEKAEIAAVRAYALDDAVTQLADDNYQLAKAQEALARSTVILDDDITQLADDTYQLAKGLSTLVDSGIDPAGEGMALAAVDATELRRAMAELQYEEFQAEKAARALAEAQRISLGVMNDGIAVLEGFRFETEQVTAALNILATETSPSLDQELLIVQGALIATGMAAAEAAGMVSRMREEIDRVTHTIQIGTSPTEIWEQGMRRAEDAVEDVTTELVRAERATGNYGRSVADATDELERLRLEEEQLAAAIIQAQARFQRWEPIYLRVQAAQRRVNEARSEDFFLAQQVVAARRELLDIENEIADAVRPLSDELRSLNAQARSLDMAEISRNLVEDEELSARERISLQQHLARLKIADITASRRQDLNAAAEKLTAVEKQLQVEQASRQKALDFAKLELEQFNKGIEYEKLMAALAEDRGKASLANLQQQLILMEQMKDALVVISGGAGGVDGGVDGGGGGAEAPPPIGTTAQEAMAIARKRLARQQSFGVSLATDVELQKAFGQIAGMSASQLEQFAEGTLAGFSFGQGMAFQRGGSFVVPGTGGPDSQRVAFMASPGERVSVTRPGQGGAVQQTIIVQGSVISERQLQTLAVNAMRNATRLNDGVLNVNSVVA